MVVNHNTSLMLFETLSTIEKKTDAEYQELPTGTAISRTKFCMIYKTPTGEPLGEGSMAEVWKSPCDPEIALKYYNPATGGQDAPLREAIAWSRLHKIDIPIAQAPHPMRTSQQVPVCAVPFISGEPIEELVKTRVESSRSRRSPSKDNNPKKDFELILSKGAVKYLAHHLLECHMNGMCIGDVKIDGILVSYSTPPGGGPRIYSYRYSDYATARFLPELTHFFEVHTEAQRFRQRALQEEQEGIQPLQLSDAEQYLSDIQGKLTPLNRIDFDDSRNNTVIKLFLDAAESKLKTVINDSQRIEKIFDSAWETHTQNEKAPQTDKDRYNYLVVGLRELQKLIDSKDKSQVNPEISAKADYLAYMTSVPTRLGFAERCNRLRGNEDYPATYLSDVNTAEQAVRNSLQGLERLHHSTSINSEALKTLEKWYRSFASHMQQDWGHLLEIMTSTGIIEKNDNRHEILKRVLNRRQLQIEQNVDDPQKLHEMLLRRDKQLSQLITQICDPPQTT